jgi:hypothetical protein
MTPANNSDSCPWSQSPPPMENIMGDEYEIPTKLTTTAGGNDVGGRPPASPNPKRTSSMPSPFASTELSTRRLRSNSGGPMPHEEYLRNLTAAEMNSIAPPAPVYKIVLTGGPCGGKTTALARVSRRFIAVDDGCTTLPSEFCARSDDCHLRFTDGNIIFMGRAFRRSEP